MRDAQKPSDDGQQTKQLQLGDYEKRTLRARHDVDAIIKATGGGYLVRSADAETAYHVDLDAETCECPDHEYRGVRCKHIRAASDEAGDLR